MDNTYILLATAISFLITFFSTPLFIKIAIKAGLVDDPQKRKHPANTHTGIIPRAGGLPIYCGIFIATSLFIPLNKIMIGILVASTLLLIIGILDDHFDTSPYVRFFLNIVIALVVVLFGIGIPYISNPFSSQVIFLDSWRITVDFFGTHTFLVFANIFAILWIVSITNFVNWSKGVDGQLPGFVAISSFFLGVLAYRFTAHDISTTTVALFAFIVAGAFAGFLPFNYYPQKMMPGYSGGALAGFMLALLSILSWGKLGTLILVLSVPFIDAIYALIRRLVKKKSPFYGDAGHFHHRLLTIGWGKRRIAFFYWFVSLLFGFSSLFLQKTEKILAFILVVCILTGFILIIDKLNVIQHLDNKNLTSAKRRKE